MGRLKPCPFCGGKAVFRSTAYHYIDGAHLGKSVIAPENKDHEEYFVYCTKCRVMQYLTYKTPEEAAKNWNERREK